MRTYGNNGLRTHPDHKPYPPDCADVQNGVLPGCRIRNKNKKRRCEKKVTRQTAIKALKADLMEH